ncbi:MAG TPA: 50S ribosomal protein L2 [Fibrobacteria bacterium]|jgi:large subunit ribosomal protein L2|nr:50S ribosomal protein L2 [Fibrobacteria bacterium]
MPLKSYRPLTKTLRYKQTPDFAEITTNDPYKPLTEGLMEKAGRNNNGRITVRRRGGGHKRLYRIIDFRRERAVPAVVETIEYDPNRSARIALVKHTDGQRRYILAAEGLQVGAKLLAGDDATLEVGNVLPLSKLPMNTFVHNVELKPGKGAQLARSAGTQCEVVAREGEYVHLKLPSGEIRRVRAECRATVGRVGNPDHNKVVSGSAGRSRWLGKRPKVRGVAMNPVDHPHGGGEGRTSGGGHPVSPWGKKAKGKHTRNSKRTDKMIVRRRPKNS